MSDSEDDVAEAFDRFLAEAKSRLPTPAPLASAQCEICDLEILDGDKSKWAKFGFSDLHKKCFNVSSLDEASLARNSAKLD